VFTSYCSVFGNEKGDDVHILVGDSVIILESSSIALCGCYVGSADGNIGLSDAFKLHTYCHYNL